MTMHLDYNATTPVDQRLLDKIVPWFTPQFGNSASRDHVFGWDASEAVEEARGQVAHLINASPDEISFTGSATESINCALRGLVSPVGAKCALTGATEHEA